MGEIKFRVKKIWGKTIFQVIEREDVDSLDLLATNGVSIVCTSYDGFLNRRILLDKTDNYTGNPILITETLSVSDIIEAFKSFSETSYRRGDKVLIADGGLLLPMIFIAPVAHSDEYFNVVHEEDENKFLRGESFRIKLFNKSQIENSGVFDWSFHSYGNDEYFVQWNSLAINAKTDKT